MQAFLCTGTGLNFLIKFLACKTTMCTLALYSPPILSALYSIVATSLFSLVFPVAYRKDERKMLLSSNVYTGS